MRTRAGALLLVLGVLSLACAVHRRAVERPRRGTTQVGVASWYGPEYHGRKTASGERFDQDALTAAHATWAFETRVKVTVLATGRSVVVRINDRFGRHKGRLIDLSRGAARKIGLIGPGTARVRLEVVG
jgi:rare lipoprotein A